MMTSNRMKKMSVSFVKQPFLAKFKRSKLATSTAIAVGTLLTLSSQPSLAASKKIDKRWFEIEVILFSQLRSPADVDEKFADKPSLPNYRYIEDLLTPHLYPNTASLKQQLPNCTTGQYDIHYVEQNATIPDVHPLLSLDEINSQTDIDDALFGVDPLASDLNELNESNELNEENTEFTVTETYALNSATTVNPIADESVSPDAIDNQQDLSPVIEQQDLTGVELLSTQSAPPPTPPITEQELALVAEAESTFNKYATNLTLSYNDKLLCSSELKSPKDYVNNQAYSIKDSNSGRYAFPIQSLTGAVDGNEFVYTDDPYLIDSDSLALKDIYLQLRRSKNFRPLLHVGWRQSLINRLPPEQTTAFRLFAGDHFEQDYLTKLDRYKDAKQQHEFDLAQQHLQAQELVNRLDDENQANSDAESKVLATSETMVNEHLSRLFSDLEQVDAINSESLRTPSIDSAENELNNLPSNMASNIASKNSALSKEALFSALNLPKLDTSVVNIDSDNDSFEQIMSAPEAPLQPWFIDGLFRVHLNHYLFITADFNIANMNLAQLESHKLATSNQESSTQNNAQENDTFKIVSFSQNKRVISKEIHYFDHPYMGMIVQIRRYKKPEPPALDASE